MDACFFLVAQVHVIYPHFPPRWSSCDYSRESFENAELSESRVMSQPIPAGLRLTLVESREEGPLDSNVSTSCGESIESKDLNESVKRRGPRRFMKLPKSCAPPLQVEEDGRNEKSIQHVEDVEKLFTEDKTTVMVRNIPSCYNCEELLGDILAQSFEGTFDFFYLPIDFNTKRNRGYCFLNFRSSHWAREFVRTFHGQTLTRYCTKKILEISPAVTQGLENNMKCFKRCKPRVKNQWFRPMVFGLDDEDYQKICADDE